MGTKIVVHFVYEIFDDMKYSVVVFGEVKKGMDSKRFVAHVATIGDFIDVSVGILRHGDAKSLGLVILGAWQASKAFEWYIHYVKYAGNLECMEVCTMIMTRVMCFEVDPRDDYASKHLNRIFNFVAKVMKAASKIVSMHSTS